MTSRQLECRAHASTHDSGLVLFITGANAGPETICICLVPLGLAPGVPVSGRRGWCPLDLKADRC